MQCDHALRKISIDFSGSPLCYTDLNEGSARMVRFQMSVPLRVFLSF